ncbi:G-protein coupled receptor 61 [Callorhinchus milii]|uniref:G protein-coupled receptor 61 n=1 Tax=Callorhinchus milii TaxID=7868 RepID=A0A4W3IQY5_CALMI|nr:G-protein coupled receptor 61 [Callorhinchus milii]|eukprot:gi/632962940/ref/XP_007897605.1/ PREDICTED: probable G-protein coupled receptor 61 [Callorhinchus milii]
MAAASQEGWTWNGSAAGRPSEVSPTSTALNGSLVSAPTDIVSQSIGLFFMLLVDLVGIIGNAAVILVIIRTPLLKKFVFVFHLCLVDLLAALVLMPLGMVTSSGLFGSMALGEILCRIYLFLNMLFISASILSILTINVERYYYIVHPMRYEGRVTVRLVVSVIVCVWIKAALMSVVPVLGCLAHGSSTHRSHCCSQWNVDKYRKVFVVFFSVFYFLLPVFIILTVYCGMFRVARVAAMQRGPLPIWLDTPRRRSESLSSRSTMVTSSGLQRSSPQRTFGGGKAAAILVLVGGQFVLCWLPFFAFHLYSAMTPGLGPEEPWEAIVTWIGYTSFSANPFFYGCLNRQIRGALSKHLSCLFTPAVEEEPALPSREGSIEENFLQFLQRTGCTTDTRASSPKPDQPALAFHIPGQILEETCEFLEQQIASDFSVSNTCVKLGRSPNHEV